MRRQTNRINGAPVAARASGVRPTVLEVIHAGVAYRVAVKRIGTARRFTLRVRAATRDAVLTMPARASIATALSFAERHAEWIGTRLCRLPGLIVFVPGATIPLRGIDHRIVHDPSPKLRRWAEIGRAEDGTAELRVTGPLAEVGRHVLDCLRREAHHDFAAAAARHAAAVRKSFARIAIRDTISRWGSCSSRGTLSFSWRLVLAPPFVLDYLVAHEVAHLCHMDHSDAFWAVTEQLAPQTAVAEAWLKRNGPTLHRYAAP